MVKLFHDQEPVGYFKMMEEWERTKCNFDPETSGDVIYFNIPTRLYNFISKRKAKILEQLADEQNGDDENIHLSDSTMENIFGPTLDGLVSTVKNQFKELGDEEVDIIFLVGGFSTSPVLRQRIKKEFGSKAKKIVMPPRPGVAILKGAASFGVAPGIIRARRSRLTYGVSSSREFNQFIDPESKKFWAEDLGRYQCDARFRTLVTIGESVPVNKEIVFQYSPLKAEDKSMYFRFYATFKKEVRYIDEKGVEKIGEMTVEMPSTEGDVNRIVDLFCCFGDTEIKVKGVDRTSGYKCKASLRFLYSY